MSALGAADHFRHQPGYRLFQLASHGQVGPKDPLDALRCQQDVRSEGHAGWGVVHQGANNTWIHRERPLAKNCEQLESTVDKCASSQLTQANLQQANR